jgi:hypothetical protein
MKDERPQRLSIGDPVHVGGGYDMDPAWLAANPDGYDGTVVEIIPGQNEEPAVVVELERELVLPDGAGNVRGREVRGRFLVLELRNVGPTWAQPHLVVHVEVCVERPPPRRWSERPQGAWVESHASVSRRRPQRTMPAVLPPIGEPSPWP